MLFHLCRRSSLYIFLAATLALAPLNLRAQDNQGNPDNPLHTATKQELDVVKVLLAQEAAWNRGDIETFTKGYKDSPDTIFISSQINRGYSGLLQEYRREYPNKAAMGTLAFSEIEVHALDEKFAVCVGRYQLDRSKKEGGHAEGLFSLVFEKTAQGWKIVVDHTT